MAFMVASSLNLRTIFTEQGRNTMFKKTIAGMALFSFMTVSAEACTVMVVTKGASTDGSMIVSHSNDGRGAEMNLIYVPAKDHPKGSKRPVYPTAVALDPMPEYNAFDQPNLVAPERSEGYNYPGKPRTIPIGTTTITPPITTNVAWQVVFPSLGHTS